MAKDELIFDDNDLGSNNSGSDVTNTPSVHDGAGGDDGTTDISKVEDKPADKGDDKPTDKETPSDDTSTDDKTKDTDAGDDKDTDTSTDDSTDGGDSEGEQEVFIDKETGNLVDSTGKVYAEKGQFEVDDEGNVTLDDDATVNVEDDFQAVKEQIKNDFGIDLVDAEGNALEFDGTPEGFSKLAGTVAEKFHESQLNDLFEELPQVKSYLDHVIAGGTDSTFFNQATNYSGLNIPEDSDTNKEANKVLRRNILIQKEILSRGGANMETEAFEALQKEVEDYVEYLFDKGVEKDQADNAVDWLKSYEAQQNQERDAANQKAIEANRKANEEYWDNVKSIVDTGELKGINIPKAERDAFYKYLAVPVGNTGKSQQMLDREKQGHDLGLTLEYLRFKNFDLDKFIEQRANTKQSEKLKLMAANSHKSKNSRGKTLKIKTKGVSLDKLNLQYLSQKK